MSPNYFLFILLVIWYRSQLIFIYYYRHYHKLIVNFLITVENFPELVISNLLSIFSKKRSQTRYLCSRVSIDRFSSTSSLIITAIGRDKHKRQASAMTVDSAASDATISRRRNVFVVPSSVGCNSCRKFSWILTYTIGSTEH